MHATRIKKTIFSLTCFFVLSICTIVVSEENYETMIGRSSSNDVLIWIDNGELELPIIPYLTQTTCYVFVPGYARGLKFESKGNSILVDGESSEKLEFDTFSLEQKHTILLGGVNQKHKSSMFFKCKRYLIFLQRLYIQKAET